MAVDGNTSSSLNTQVRGFLTVVENSLEIVDWDPIVCSREMASALFPYTTPKVQHQRVLLGI
jgi:hypothetical protein